MNGIKTNVFLFFITWYDYFMQIQKVIENLGFSAKEAKVYLVALYLGESHISDIAAKVKMPRSSVQVIIDRLHKEGLMNFYTMRRYKYWVAENPEKLLATLKQREVIIQEALPKLVAIKKAGWEKRPKADSENSPLEILRMLADSSDQPILIANESVGIEYVNGAWEKQFGYALEEVRGKNPKILDSGKTPRHVYEKMWKVLRTGQMFQSDEIIDKKKNGSFFNLLTTIFSLKRKGRLFYVQILNDITEHKRAEQLQQRFSKSAGS